MTDAPLPDLARAIGPLLGGLPPAHRPLLVAMAERLAAERYRRWAADPALAAHAEDLLACADREEAIAGRVESLEADAPAIQRSLAEAHPEIPVVVCHTGFPYDRSEPGIAQWHAGMRALARLPHCHAKLSGPCMVMRDWTVERFAPFFHETVDVFGPERCMFASNVPPDSLAKPFDAIYEDFTLGAFGPMDMSFTLQTYTPSGIGTGPYIKL